MNTEEKVAWLTIARAVRGLVYKNRYSQVDSETKDKLKEILEGFLRTKKMDPADLEFLDGIVLGTMVYLVENNLNRREVE